MNHIKTAADVRKWVQIMDEVGIETLVVYLDATGEEFEKMAALFRPYGKRFILYCSIDLHNIGASDYPQRAVRELERCYRNGARGIGELSDKGWGVVGGMVAADPAFENTPRNQRMHPDDPRLGAFWENCAELKLPVRLHVADHPSWHRDRGAGYRSGRIRSARRISRRSTSTARMCRGTGNCSICAIGR
jgi:uncharacterized protein